LRITYFTEYTITNVYGPFCRLYVKEVKREWGEAFWTAMDLL